MTEEDDSHALKGVAFGLPFERYLAHPGLSKSALATFADMGNVDREKTCAMELGSLVHCAILEPYELDKKYYWTSARRGTRAWDTAVEKSEGREIVKDSDYFIAADMASSFEANSEAMDLVRDARIEASSFWTDQATGLQCKARPDILGTELADLKTCQSAMSSEFCKDAYSFRYDWQEAWYLAGLEANGIKRERMVFIAIEKTAKRLTGMSEKRHHIGLFETSAADKARAFVEVHEFSKLYAYCERNNDWPQYMSGIQTINKPTWMIRRDEVI